MCGDFASHGCIVCAVEHRDGSGPITFVNLPGEGSRDAPSTRKQKDNSTRTSSTRLEYVFPKGNADDTRPSNEVCVIAHFSGRLR
jgi:platelet-activating factor acetylhydrolase